MATQKDFDGVAEVVEDSSTLVVPKQTLTETVAQNEEVKLSPPDKISQNSDINSSVTNIVESKYNTTATGNVTYHESDSLIDEWNAPLLGGDNIITKVLTAEDNNVIGDSSPQRYSVWCLSCNIISTIILGIFLASFNIAITFLLLLPYYVLLFRCGTVEMKWFDSLNNQCGGGCPWCSSGQEIRWLIFFGPAIFSTFTTLFFVSLMRAGCCFSKLYKKLNSKKQSCSIYFTWPTFYTLVGCVVSVIAFLSFGLILAITVKLASGYPYFLFVKELRPLTPIIINNK